MDGGVKRCEGTGKNCYPIVLSNISRYFSPIFVAISHQIFVTGALIFLDMSLQYSTQIILSDRDSSTSDIDTSASSPTGSLFKQDHNFILLPKFILGCLHLVKHIALETEIPTLSIFSADDEEMKR